MCVSVSVQRAAVSLAAAARMKLYCSGTRTLLGPLLQAILAALPLGYRSKVSAASSPSAHNLCIAGSI